MKKLTVCILTYRRADFLKIAIERILQQSFTDFDLVIVDDCSPDNTADVVNSFSDPRITYVRNEKNLGFNANYNKALSLAKSPYVLLTHDDDEMTPTFLEREVAALDENPEVAMVASNTESIDQQSVSLKEREIDIHEDILYQSGEYIDACMKRGIGLCCPTFMFRRSFLEQTGIRFRNVGPGSDVIICLETNLEHPIYLIGDPLFRFRAHDGQDHIQLKNYMRADLKKELNIWRMLKSTPSAEKHLPQIAYNMTLAFPVHIVADTIETDDQALSPEDALNQLFAQLEEDEQQIVSNSPKFRLLQKTLSTSAATKTFDRTLRSKASNHLAALVRHNDHLVESWIKSETPITRFLTDREIKKVALWGVGAISIILHQELEKSGIETLAIIDNDPRKSGHRFLSFPITPFSLNAIPRNTDAIITCIESYHDLFIRQQISESEIGRPISVYSWKELALFQSPAASQVS